MKHGLVIGKFYPPHKGHHHVIDTALAECDKVTVIVLWSAKEKIPYHFRVRWLRDHYRNGPTILEAQDEYPVDYESEEIWNSHVRIMLQTLYFADPEKLSPITHIYGSENYIYRLAQYFDAVPRIVDLERRQFPTSGTAVRSDPGANWQFLEAPVRSWMALQRRVVVIGAESTGTTTLTRDLAEHYNTVWVPEYGRTYTEGLITNARWEVEDFTHIINMQERMEREYARKTTLPLLLCDTDILATSVWQKMLLGGSGLWASRILGHLPTLYLVTSPDGVAWEDDGTRFGEGDFRQKMHENFNLQTVTLGRSVLIHGSPDERLQTAVHYIDTEVLLPFDFSKR